MAFEERNYRTVAYFLLRKCHWLFKDFVIKKDKTPAVNFEKAHETHNTSAVIRKHVLYKFFFQLRHEPHDSFSSTTSWARFKIHWPSSRISINIFYCFFTTRALEFLLREVDASCVMSGWKYDFEHVTQSFWTFLISLLTDF